MQTSFVKAGEIDLLHCRIEQQRPLLLIVQAPCSAARYESKHQPPGRTCFDEPRAFFDWARPLQTTSRELVLSIKVIFGNEHRRKTFRFAGTDSAKPDAQIALPKT
jgi:hypothetical protein